MGINYISFPGIRAGTNLDHVVMWEYLINEANELTGCTLSMRHGRDIHLPAQEALLFKQELADRERLTEMQEQAESN